MAWGKIIGGALGAMVGGPIGAGIGVAIGSGFDGAAEDELRIDADSLQEPPFRITPTGNILRFESITMLSQRATYVVVRFGWGERYVKSLFRGLADSDGDFVLSQRVVGRKVTFELPLHVLSIARNSDMTLHVLVSVMKEDIEVDRIEFPLPVRIVPELWSTVRWMDPVVDLLAHYALLSGSWTSEKVRFLKEAFQAAAGPEPHEANALRERLKLVRRPSWDASIDAINVRFDHANRLQTVLPLVAIFIVKFGIPSGAPSEEIRRVGWRLRLPHDEVDAVIQRFGSIDDDDDEDWDFGGGDDDDEDDDGYRRDRGHGSSGEGSAAPDPRQQAGGILGVPVGADRATVQKAWRKKISELHPDKYANLPESVQTLIKEKAQEINRARDILLD